MLLFLLALAALPAGAHQKPAPLPVLKIDPAQTTVSGISSGGHMAVQLHVAHSARFAKGAAVIAGGPYDCAQGNVLHALTRCLGKAAIPVDSLIAATRKAAAEDSIDALANLAGSRVYVFSMARDSVVAEGTSAALVKFYEAFLPAARIAYKKDVPADHGFVTDEGGAACDNKAAPFLNNCGFDLPGALLGHLYGPLKPRSTGTPDGKLLEFDQGASGAPAGLGAKGYLYVPASCAGGSLCRVHVALHGCRMNAGDIGDAFARGAGYNRWADTNDIVVLYPQTGAGAVNGCWDWWGYTGANYAKKGAPQMKAILGMLDRLAGVQIP
jgi:poly(3-hydroxybutyrate) depolymerase